MKKHNKLLSVIFFAVAALFSAAELLYAADNYHYYTGVDVVLTAAKTVLMFISAAFFVVGTVSSHRTAIIAGEACFSASAAASILLSFAAGLFGYGELIFMITPAVSLAAMIMLIIYTGGGIKNKYAPAVILTAAYAMLIIRAFFEVNYFFGIVDITEAVMLSALIIMLIYPDISDSARVKTTEMVWLSAVSFGIYLILWEVSLVKKTASLSENGHFKAKAAFFVLIGVYRPYWFYTSYEEQNVLKNRGVLLMALSALGLAAECVGLDVGMPELLIFGVGMFVSALALLQRDLNSLIEEPEEPEEPEKFEESEEVEESEEADDSESNEEAEAKLEGLEELGEPAEEESTQQPAFDASEEA